MTDRHHTPLDRLLSTLNSGLQTLLPGKTTTSSPADERAETALSPEERTLSAQLLRIDHCGEVCAQALYLGQALVAQEPLLRTELEQAGKDEENHLRWCRQRLLELDDRTSLLDPLFFAGALSLGTLAGLAGDRWSLGFLAETERQVESHLEGQLATLPSEDERSRAILEQMKEDEVRHSEMAVALGGAELPQSVKQLMKQSARIMVATTRWI